MTKPEDEVRVRRFERIDFAADELPRKQVTQDGFWRVAGRVARTGIQEYRDSSGGIRRELRLPEEVRASLPSFALQPLTNDHPPQMVTPENAKRYVAGAVGEAQFSDGWVTAPLTIYDAAAIRAVENGRAQLSVGYTCRLEAAAGMWEGQKYDAVQREVVVNHVAIVDIARAGAGASIRLDAGDAIAGVIWEKENDVVAWNQETSTMAHKFKLDGFEVEVADTNAEAVIRRAIEAARKQGEDEAAAQKTRADASDKARDTLNSKGAELAKAFDVLQGKYDTLEAKQKADAAESFKLDGVDVLIADFRDPAKRDAVLAGAISKAAGARTALVIEARKHLGEKEKLDGKSDLDVKKMVVLKLSKTAKLDGKSEDYVQACYDTAVEGVQKISPIDAARAAATSTSVLVAVQDAADGSPEDAYKRQVAAYKSFNGMPQEDINKLVKQRKGS